MEKQVFISYSRDDQNYVDRLAEWLRTSGIPVWLDHNIDYGDTWTRQIEKQLDASDAVVVVMSVSSRESTWVGREIARAERKQKPTFPILLSGDPFLQFETTQYEDVKDGSLPSPRFADTLASSMGLALRGLGSDLIGIIERYRESGVLILGRLTSERKAMLDAIRDALRKRGFIPILFDFEVPHHLSLTEMLLLFSLAVRFIIADLTDARSLPHELSTIIPAAEVPIRPIIMQGHAPLAMFDHFMKYPWVIEPLVYEDEDQLIENIDALVIQVADQKYHEIKNRRVEDVSPLPISDE